ncbi:unnamed protein product [Peniophora sp. CBMAI 1063]|nr:unnamed protein product [Peniophora sp. CBMAI 1063]
MSTRRTYTYLPDRDTEHGSTEPLLERDVTGLRGGSLSVRADGSYSYAYGPPGLTGLAHNRLALACAIFASLGGLTFGYDQGVIANVLVMPDFVLRWPISAWQRGIMTAVLELGCLFGALGAGVLADRLSRRAGIMFACVVFCIGSTLQCGATSLFHLTIGRAIGGLGVGALSMLSPLYMAEIASPEVRGSLLALEQFSIVLGCVLGFWTGFFTRTIEGSMSWRVPLGIQLIPGVLLGLGTYFLPPSPRLLVLKGSLDAARASLVRLRGRPVEDPLLEIELLEMQVEALLIQRAHVPAETKHTHALAIEARAWARLFNPQYRARTLVGVLIMVFQQWSGINALLYYGPTLMRALGLGGGAIDLMVAGGVNVVQFIAVLPAILYIDRWGRRPMLRAGAAAMTIAHLAVAMLVHFFEGRWSEGSGAGWIAVACVYAFTAAYGVSFGPVAWVLPSEVFPLSMRGKGVALSTASNWVNNFLIGLITPPLLDYSPSLTFGTFAGACFLAYLWATHFVPETAGMPLEAIDAAFDSDAGKGDALLKKQIERDIGLEDLVRRLGGVVEEGENDE